MVTATTFMVLTNVNKFAVIAFGIVALHDDIAFVSGIGVCMAMGGGIWYGRARARMQEFATPPPTVPKSQEERLPLVGDSKGATG